MTLRQAERITGEEILLAQYGVGGWVCVIGVLAGVCGRTEKEALSRAVEGRYRQVRDQVIRAQGALCFLCGRVRPLQGDHIVKRGRGGRLDRFENLRGMCASCHEYRELHPQEKLRPHVKVAAAMAKNGWAWEARKEGWCRTSESST